MPSCRKLDWSGKILLWCYFSPVSLPVSFWILEYMAPSLRLNIDITWVRRKAIRPLEYIAIQFYRSHLGTEKQCLFPVHQVLIAFGANYFHSIIFLFIWNHCTNTTLRGGHVTIISRNIVKMTVKDWLPRCFAVIERAIHFAGWERVSGSSIVIINPFHLICPIYVLPSFFFVNFPVSSLIASNTNDSALFFQFSKAAFYCRFWSSYDSSVFCIVEGSIL